MKKQYGFEFDTEAEKALQAAESISKDLHHGYVGTEHLLLGLLTVYKSPWRALDVDPRELLDYVKSKMSGPGPGVLAGKLKNPLLTPRLNTVLALADKKRTQMAEEEVRCGHLLWALREEHEGLAARILIEQDITPPYWEDEDARREMEKSKNQQAPSPLPIKSNYPWDDAYNSLILTIEEDVAILENIINDPDSSCPARGLRQERLNTLQYVLSLADNLKHWEF